MAAITRQMMEVKLLEKHQVPKNVQVVTQATSETLVIFLVDKNDVICKYNSREPTG